MNRSNRLDYLIKELSPSASVPSDTDGKWRLLRALVNVHEPKPISGEFLAEQDKLLKSMIAEKGITDIADLRPVRKNLYIWRGDITTLKVGAIVNAANSGMLGCFVPSHACVDNAIHTFAGVQLRLECAAIMQEQKHPEPAGKAKITSAYNLPSKYILHTVGPIITGELTQRDCDLLSACYRSCLELAEQNAVGSVAFCCISTGEFCFPNERAAEIAVAAVEKYIDEKRSKVKVIFNVFKERDFDIYRRILG
ncbi:MAG: protein-ADP-ribose hydrolase [Clostridiales bacterium]|jgi:O-acetyl-ADP-ribose deacetylase (regulator of RNase III)|nr:protein-ADP-ribose hydrolase [Clostridiales bacterium]